MAQTDYAATNTRVHWGGADSTIDQHLEIYKGLVDTRFGYQALFRMLSQQRTTVPDSNNYRIDRMNTSQVHSRKAGEKLQDQRVTSNKLNVIVEALLYIRNTLDWQDQWTSPDRLRELSDNNGYTMAEAYDEAHLIQLIKARSWVAPTELKPAFNDGIEIRATIKDNATTQADIEANAIALELAHKAAIETLIKRKTPMSDMVTVVTPEVFSILTQHPKLLNKDFSDPNGSYADRRVLRVNGVPVVEMVTFPTQKGTEYEGGHHPLSTTSNQFSFDCTEDDLKVQMVIFSKSHSLVTVEAKGLTSQYIPSPEQFVNILDIYHMFTVATRRPDTVACVHITKS